MTDTMISSWIADPLYFRDDMGSLDVYNKFQVNLSYHTVWTMTIKSLPVLGSISKTDWVTMSPEDEWLRLIKRFARHPTVDESEQRNQHGFDLFL